MRRSKSDPAKYARNYRSISQRRMTEYDEVDEEKEMDRLRSMLRESESHLSNQACENEESQHKGKRKGNLRPDKRGSKQLQQDKIEASSILSEEMRKEMELLGDDALVLPPRKKKAKKTTKAVELTSQEVRQAKLEQKKITRKLKQLKDRADQKKRRADLYAKLKDHAISVEESQLLSSSSTLGKRISKREALKKALQRERAGIQLTEEERSLLYTERRAFSDDKNLFSHNAVGAEGTGSGKEELGIDKSKKKKRKKSTKKSGKNQTDDSDQEEIDPLVSDAAYVEVVETGTMQNSSPESCGIPASIWKEPQSDQDESKCIQPISNNEIQDTDKASQTREESRCQTKKIAPNGPLESKPKSFASQMMSSILKLKVRSDEKIIENENGTTEKVESLGFDIQTREDSEKNQRASYIPTNPAVLKTAAAMGLKVADDTKANRKVFTVNRPPEVEETRYDLPVCGMEYEIIDAVRSSDVTIVCSQTGSGKSTQVPQFLYETGFSQGTNEAEPLIIGVTQPRRVAAVSTAKRVCYEMGHGDGQTIQRGSDKKGNLVAYQTRYESAGLGQNTRIKFMTDGILLKEIQSDLLLRRYGVIVLDEAHERNLNTDVLLGLLSVALPLRRKAAAEEGSGIVPLKVIVMSATLRVEDFTKNEKLFPSICPAVVKIPGRTYPVTIHHSKVTELDDYETAAFNKVCKIHRKLPQGGILVFLTGKQEIVRMVNRLKNAFGQKKARKNANSALFSGRNDISVSASTPEGECVDNCYRDLDDDEFDGDLFQDTSIDDFDSLKMEEEEEDGDSSETVTSSGDDSIPKQVHVLPLYSMLAVEEQAKVFAPLPEGNRLIIVATNIAETSLTIPGISYVVDTGRQKCRNYHSATGAASYDVMWISKAAADQRAGRAGRNSPGHCYRLYSSSMYSRHMDAFALPEVLTRPLEDVVLAMKAMSVKNVANFPFPTPPDQRQLDAALNLLANLGCVDTCKHEHGESDGEITSLGAAVSGLPLGVRYGKMLLVAAQAGVLDYAIAMVAVLSETSPFEQVASGENKSASESTNDSSLDEVDRHAAGQAEKERKGETKRQWTHKGGDVLAGMLAAGAYAYVGKGAGGATERAACRQFCEENGLSYVVMSRIQKMRLHLARLSKARLRNAKGVAAKTGAVLSTMPPPNRLQEKLLTQALASGLLDNVAVLAPPGSLANDHPFSLRSAYVSCSSSIKEPLFMDKASVVYSRDSRRMPEWVCYDSIVRKTKDGVPMLVMKNITPIDAAWLGKLSTGSRLLSLGIPLLSPFPTYDSEKDVVLCSVVTKFGSQGWDIPPVRVEMYSALQSEEAKRHSQFQVDDSFRWFGRFLLEGKVLKEFKLLPGMLNDDPAIITRKVPVSKVALFVSALSNAGVDSATALIKHWAEVDTKFLFKNLMGWTKPSDAPAVKQLWVETVKKKVSSWSTASLEQL